MMDILHKVFVDVYCISVCLFVSSFVFVGVDQGVSVQQEAQAVVQEDEAQHH